jgi:hypothetical protein
MDMPWIEDIVESTSTPPLFINSRVVVGFVKPHKVIAKRNAFSTFPSVQNGVESEGGIESEELKGQFSQVEGVLNLQEIPIPIPISNKRALKKEKHCGET